MILKQSHVISVEKEEKIISKEDSTRKHMCYSLSGF